MRHQFAERSMGAGPRYCRLLVVWWAWVEVLVWAWDWEDDEWLEREEEGAGRSWRRALRLESMVWHL